MNMVYQIARNMLDDTYGHFHLRATRVDGLCRKTLYQSYGAAEAEHAAQVAGLTCESLGAAYRRCQELNKQPCESV
jgi:hypothetical protein